MRIQRRWCLMLASFSSMLLLGQVNAGKSYLSPKYPYYADEGNRVGYISSDLTSFKDVLWLTKHYGLPDDRSYSSLDDDDDVFLGSSEENEIDEFPFSGTMKKRDYTASQLLDMLRQLARSRGRHRQIRIAGKSLRFGISRK